MPEENLTVVALLKIDKEKIDDLKKELTELQRQTRLEKGCVTYDLHQSLDDESIFMFFEIWKSKADLEKHMRSAHFQKWSKKEKDFVRGPAQLLMMKKIS
jgi:quinol monooxygenase YgiN